MALKLLRDYDKYDELRGKLQFSNRWFLKWKKTFKVGHHTIHGHKKHFPKDFINGIDDAYVENGSDKLRLTAGSFANADGSDSFHTFLVKNYPRDLKRKAFKLREPNYSG